MALKIGLSSYVSAGFVNPVRWDLKEDVSGIKIDQHIENGPHGQIYNFAWTDNIRDIAYRIEFYDVPGGVGLGNLIKSHVVTPSTGTIAFETDLELVVGGEGPYDPAINAHSVVIDILKGRDFYVQQRGIGQLLQTRDVEITHDDVNGGFAFTADDQNFNEGDIFIIKIVPQLIINPSGTVTGSSIYKDVVYVTADTTIEASDYGKLFIVDGAAAVVTLQLPAIADTIPKLPLFIESVGTSHINVIIKAAFGELITSSGDTSQTFILGRAEKGQIIRMTDTLFGFTDSIDIKRVGQLEFGYSVGVNRLWGDGTEYLSANYPRIIKAMNKMQMGTVLDYATWAMTTVINGVETPINKGKFALSGDGTHFKVPDWRNKSSRFERYSDGSNDDQRLSQGAGGYQTDMTGKHTHFIANNDSDDNLHPPSADNHLLKSSGYNGDFKYILQATPTMPTLIKTSDGGGTETRPENYSQIPLIII